MISDGYSKILEGFIVLVSFINFSFFFFAISFHDVLYFLEYIILKFLYFLICLLLMNFFAQLQRIMYPLEGEGTASSSRSIQKTSIHGAIWSMCFISQDSRQLSKEHNPVLAVIINRYADSYIGHCQEFVLGLKDDSTMEVSFCFLSTRVMCLL